LNEKTAQYGYSTKAGCREPIFENAGSKNSLLEDRDACAMEMEQNPAAIASELAQSGQPTPRSDSKATEAFVLGVEERLASMPSSTR
jgi:hypothetical protein